jgi:hypothetical protein
MDIGGIKRVACQLNDGTKLSSNEKLKKIISRETYDYAIL